MKILFVVPYVPNLIRVRPYQLLRALLRRGHQITLATLWTSEEEQRELKALSDLGIRVVAQPLPTWRSLLNTVAALPTRVPLQADYCWQPTLAQRIRQLLTDEVFDVVHVEHLRGARYGLYIKALRPQLARPVPIVWDSVDCISHLFAQAAERSRSLKGRIMTRLDLARTQAYEGQLVGQFDEVTVTSPSDKAALEALIGKTAPHLHVLPNGVDLDYFTPNGNHREAGTVVFSGKMSYHANITAALHLVHDIMPKVWMQRPEVKVWLVGKDPSADIRALAESRADSPTQKGSVIVTGTVDDIRPYIHKSAAAVAPVPYGAGIQNKVLEAMACGAPVIASPQACSALQAQPGRDLLVAETPERFAETLLELLGNPGQQQSLGLTARSYVERHHSWDAISRQLEAVYQSAIMRSREAKG